MTLLFILACETHYLIQSRIPTSSPVNSALFIVRIYRRYSEGGGVSHQFTARWEVRNIYTGGVSSVDSKM